MTSSCAASLGGQHWTFQPALRSLRHAGGRCLAPLFGGDTDPHDTRDAMVAIYRYVALPSSGETVSTTYF